MKYFIIAGEASGDLYGSYIARQIKSLDQSAKIKAWGGDLMASEGVEIEKHIRELAFMGFVEVVANLRTIKKNFKKCKKDILSFNPDMIIFVDYPGFNIRISKWTKKQGFRSVYFISPTVWAWKASRVYKIRDNNEGIVCILPFEKDFYAKFGIEVQYFGHPLAEIIENYRPLNSQDFRKKNKLDDKPIIAILPGSRQQELKHILPEILPVIPKFPEYNFVIAATHNLPEKLYESLTKNHKISIIYDQTYDLMANSVAGLIKSGTSTLEAALFNLPQVVCYKANPISVAIAKRLAKVKYISLVNIILDKLVVTELIQNELTPDNVEKQLKKILYNDEILHSIKENYIYLHKILNQPRIFFNVAKYIVSLTLNEKEKIL